MDEQNPYTTPQAVVADMGDGELADRGARLGAAIIDGLILMAILLPLMFFGGYFSAAMDAAAQGRQVGIGTTLMWGLIGLAVFVAVQFVPLNANGQTWGKKVLGIKIVDLAGGKPPVGKLIGLRYLPMQVAGAIPVVGPIIGLVNILMIFRGDRRCGHDLIAGTRVVTAK